MYIPLFTETHKNSNMHLSLSEILIELPFTQKIFWLQNHFNNDFLKPSLKYRVLNAVLKAAIKVNSLIPQTLGNTVLISSPTMKSSWQHKP